ncbi:hypothetical protein B0H14DRAFT_1633830 [Mycena olivaceomarginata]|nr:hypothetical protein B0H14DRAFT_1633830 [Mycena olivaceomarginata]
MVSESPTSPQSDSTIPIHDIWIDALSRYKEETGFDLKKERDGDYRDLHDCSSPEDALRLLTGLADTPHIAQQKRTRLAFSNVFKFVLTVNDAVAELAASLQVPGGKAIFVAFGILLKTVLNMEDRLCALAELFFKFEQFFCRLDLRRGISYPVRDQEILTRICAEFLHVLALAQKIIGRDSRQGNVRASRLPVLSHHPFSLKRLPGSVATHTAPCLQLSRSFAGQLGHQICHVSFGRIDKHGASDNRCTNLSSSGSDER